MAFDDGGDRPIDSAQSLALVLRWPLPARPLFTLERASRVFDWSAPQMATLALVSTA